jgi:hypothetical protein
MQMVAAVVRACAPGGRIAQQRIKSATASNSPLSDPLVDLMA